MRLLAILVGMQLFLNNVIDHWSGYLAAVGSIGVVSMALLQIIKDATPARRAFQHVRLEQWLREGAEQLNQVIPPVNWSNAESDLITLATDGDSAALFDLQIEQLAGQMNAAAQVAIAYPTIHRDLLAILASSARNEDLNELLSSGPPPRSDQDQRYYAYVDARTRVTQQIQRAIDAFQIATGFRWQWLMKLVAFAISTVIALLALSTSTAHNAIGGPTVVSVLVTAVLSGYLAPVARDLQVALQNARS